MLVCAAVGPEQRLITRPSIDSDVVISAEAALGKWKED